MKTKTKPQTMKTKTKPQVFADSMGVTPKLTLIIEGGIITQVVRKACQNIEIEIMDYDVDGDDESLCLKDKQGKLYKKINLD